MKDPDNTSNCTKPCNGVNLVSAHRIPRFGGTAVREVCSVVVEDTLTIDIENVGKYTLMWTPTENMDGAVGYTNVDGVLSESELPEAFALAVGFAFTEGIIRGIDDIQTMALCPDELDVVQMRLVNPEQVTVRRSNVTITSSCGFCGKHDILENNFYELSPVSNDMKLGSEVFSHLMQQMVEGQEIFQLTGGTHAAAIFSTDGKILSIAEDLGRHNALDKVIGQHLLKNKSFKQCGVLLSSRLSLEMAVKTVRSGLEVIAAVGAPTSLAIDVADRFGVTLCGFVRGQRATVFTQPYRLLGNLDENV